MFCSFKLFLIICLIAKIPVVYFIIVLSFNVYFYQKFQKLWIRFFFFFFFFADSVLLKRKGQPDKEIVKRRNFKLAEDLITMSFEVLNFFFFFFFFFEYRGRPWTGHIFKFIEKMVFVPFWVIYLLFGYYDHLNFLVCKSASSGLSKVLIVGITLCQCLVLLPPTFTQNFTNFGQDEFFHFRAL